MFFSSWADLLRIIAVGTLAYCGLLIFLRIAGKRALSKMNAFDLVVTVAFGSTLASILLNKNVTLADGLVAIALLCLLQFGVAWASTRWERVRSVIRSEPRLLLLRGEMIEAALRNERITHEEVFAAIRTAGHAELSTIAAVVLETDGTLSVVTGPEGKALDNLRR